MTDSTGAVRSDTDEAYRPSRCRVLIVEDEGIVALDIARTLERLGYDVVAVAATGEDAIGRATELQPDLVLMDIHLRGGMDGVRAATQIKSAVSVPIVFLTAFADPATIQLAVGAEPSGYVTKPYGEVELRCAIEVALSRQRTEAALREREDMFRAMALVDDLTGLHNRRGFLHLADQFLRQLHRSEEHAVLFFIDLDRFKKINDEFGHAVGDVALREAAQVLQRSFRETDLLARLGGDEFVVLAACKGPLCSGALLERLLHELAELNCTGGHPFTLEMSIGHVCTLDGRVAGIEQLLLQADHQMYYTKRRRALTVTDGGVPRDVGP
jgi:diguanylate cyclase (GGDEF)-like protein